MAGRKRVCLNFEGEEKQPRFRMILWVEFVKKRMLTILSLEIIPMMIMVSLSAKIIKFLTKPLFTSIIILETL